ncbi:hypothetical protein BJ508DRAFT_366648 [Ascobolus immersus RN42]|uniref:Uncharacterized protein n=1 Tax=Ascobolus immersus RN42 TaxID=1160509 RepID=A0A3N4HHX6_ASCIM|nr:hypothetical protein BJ508DRAFT_366648 [Ascobolus immersus RN42]
MQFRSFLAILSLLLLTTTHSLALLHPRDSTEDTGRRVSSPNEIDSISSFPNATEPPTKVDRISSTFSKICSDYVSMLKDPNTSTETREKLWSNNHPFGKVNGACNSNFTSFDFGDAAIFNFAKDDLKKLAEKEKLKLEVLERNLYYLLIFVAAAGWVCFLGTLGTVFYCSLTSSPDTEMHIKRFSSTLLWPIFSILLFVAPLSLALPADTTNSTNSKAAKSVSDDHNDTSTSEFESGIEQFHAFSGFFCEAFTGILNGSTADPENLLRKLRDDEKFDNWNLFCNSKKLADGDKFITVLAACIAGWAFFAVLLFFVVAIGGPVWKERGGPEKLRKKVRELFKERGDDEKSSPELRERA